VEAVCGFPKAELRTLKFRIIISLERGNIVYFVQTFLALACYWESIKLLNGTKTKRFFPSFSTGSAGQPASRAGPTNRLGAEGNDYVSSFGFGIE
jgi:hypothetical protein